MIWLNDDSTPDMKCRNADSNSWRVSSNFELVMIYFENNQKKKERIDNKEWKECFNLIVMNPSIHNHNNSFKIHFIIHNNIWIKWKRKSPACVTNRNYTTSFLKRYTNWSFCFLSLRKANHQQNPLYFTHLIIKIIK